MSDALIDSLTAAVDARPDDLPLRLHLAELLLGAGRSGEAIGHAAQVLAREPANVVARGLMSSALAAHGSTGVTGEPDPNAGVTAVGAESVRPEAAPADPPPPRPGGVDWDALEGEFEGVVPPRFARTGDEARAGVEGAGVEGRAGDEARAGAVPEPVRGDADRAFDVERAAITLADVGGMQEVKKRLELAFLGPLRNPKLRALFGKSLRGGLLLYGPPGCGKTFLARAVAGEMGAAFISLSIVDVLNMWVGSSERNLHDLFAAARSHAPCVLFLDEIDALGHKRSQLTSSAMRTLVNQLLTELDGVDGNNDGVFVLAATNAPWDIDAALRRPGRLDRTVLVLPPDTPARAAILEYHLRDRPVAGIDLPALAAATEHFSGADLAHVCETAAEFAMRDAIATGEVRMISQQDMTAAVREVRPSTDAWFATARNVAMFGNESGEYDDLAAYLKKRKLL